jgi:uncharacterized protein (DUF1330 family)
MAFIFELLVLLFILLVIKAISKGSKVFKNRKIAATLYGVCSVFYFTLFLTSYNQGWFDFSFKSTTDTAATKSSEKKVDNNEKNSSTEGSLENNNEADKALENVKSSQNDGKNKEESKNGNTDIKNSKFYPSYEKAEALFQSKNYEEAFLIFITIDRDSTPIYSMSEERIKEIYKNDTSIIDKYGEVYTAKNLYRNINFDTYKQGLKLVDSKNYNEALEKFQSISSSDMELYQFSLKWIEYIKRVNGNKEAASKDDFTLEMAINYTKEYFKSGDSVIYKGVKDSITINGEKYFRISAHDKAMTQNGGTGYLDEFLVNSKKQVFSHNEYKSSGKLVDYNTYSKCL